MSYALGIDLGTTRTTAAVCHAGRDGRLVPAVVPLDALADAPGVASVLYLTSTDAVDVGEAAIRAGTAAPDRVARDFLDRVGDEVPMALGDQHYPAEKLTAALVAWIVDRVEEHVNAPASQLVLAHPGGWGAHRRAALQAALRELNLPELTMLPRPVAAAEAYAAAERLELGQEVAVYSLGASRFEAAVLRRSAFGFEMRAHADSADVLGGTLFDDLVAEHAAAELDELPVEPAELAALRAACAEAKERLSTAVAVTIPTPARSKKATVLLNRTDFDGMIRPVVEHTIRLLLRAIRGSGAEPDALRAVVLVGGCAHVPLITELVTTAVRLPVAPAEDPVTAVARGAALAGGRGIRPVGPAPSPPGALSTSVPAHADLLRLGDLAATDHGPPPPRPSAEVTPRNPPARGLARLPRRVRGGTDLDELDRQERGWDFDEEERDPRGVADAFRGRRGPHASEDVE